MDKYDVVIVGAGPCGYNAALEINKLRPDYKVLLIDRGHDIFKRHCPVLEHKLEKCPSKKGGFQECFPACSITNGFGGSGAYSDGKFNITSEFGGWLSDYIPTEHLMELIKYVDDINLSYGGTAEITNPDTPEARAIELRAMSVGVKLLRSKVRHLGTDENLKILTNIYKDLEKRIDMRFRANATDIIVEEGKIKGIVLESGEQILADHVILGVGREGSIAFAEMLKKHGVKMNQNQVDIGVRVECSNLVMDEINETLYEGKMVYRSKSGRMVRTFCSNPGGHVVVENNMGVINVNGHSYNDPKLYSKNTNFALLVSHMFDEPFNQPNEYALKISELANQITCGSVIVQKFGDLLKHRRSTPKRIAEGFVEPTLKEAVPSDLALVLPQTTLDAIIEMIDVLDHITPGIATEHTLLYGVEAKYYSSHPDISNELEVDGIENLYVGGDGAGITRGLAQAGACGVYIARNIIKKQK